VPCGVTLPAALRVDALEPPTAGSTPRAQGRTSDPNCFALTGSAAPLSTRHLSVLRRTVATERRPIRSLLSIATTEDAKTNRSLPEILHVLMILTRRGALSCLHVVGNRFGSVMP